MRAIHAGSTEDKDTARQSEATHVEKWVAQQLASAPVLTSGQLDRLQTLLAPAPMVAAKSA